ncbi:MAG: ATP-binding protein, partial [Alphaproteobacteria bacterium]
IRVADSGPGFPPEIAGRLFTPFATTKEAGMGLGLSISRSIVEAHGGRIWAAPAPQGVAGMRGADIRFTLPAYEEPGENDVA